MCTLRYVLLLLLLSAMLLLLSEGAVRLLAPQRPHMETVEGQSVAVPDPLLGHRLRPGAVAIDHSLEFTARYAINQQGLRDTALYEALHTEGRTRVLLLGDSFTFGIGSDYDHIWPVLVERELAARGRRFELVKAGVPGYDTRLEVLYLKQIFAQTAPDAVVLGFLTNDVFTNEPLESTGEELSAQPAVVRADEKDLTLHLVTLLQRLLMSNDRVYSTLYRLTPRRQYFETPPNAEVRSRLAVTSSLLSEAARFCRDHGVPLIVLSIPQLLQVLVEARGYRYEGMDIRLIDHEFERLAAEEGFRWIPVLDTLARAYREEGEDLYYRWDGHLNERGNQVVAAYFVDQLDAVLQATRH